MGITYHDAYATLPTGQHVSKSKGIVTEWSFDAGENSQIDKL